MNWFYVYRNFTLGLCLLLSVPTLGLTAHWTQGTMSLLRASYDFEGLGLYISCLSLIVFPVMLAIPEFRKNAYISYISAEIAIILCMWAQWLAFAILLIQRRIQYFHFGITCDFPAAEFVPWCSEFLAIYGVAITIFTLLLVYLFSLVLYALVGEAMGNPIWFMSVKDVQGGSNQTLSHQDNGIIEAKANSPIYTFTVGNSALVAPTMTQQGLPASTTSLGTQPVAFTHLQQSHGIPVGTTLHPQYRVQV